MKKNKSEDTEAQPPNQPQFPFLHLLPSLPIDGLTAGHFKTLAERLRRAVAANTDGLTLSEEEARNFRENCNVIRKVNLGLELRNYSLLEIYEARQWRADYQSVKDFANSFAKMSKSQLMKCVDSATIRLIIVEAELDAVAPKGRQVEALAMVPPDYRIPAWLYALKVFEIDGKSSVVAENALRDFCRDRDLTYGRRQANGSKNIGLTSSLPANKIQLAMEPVHQKTRNSANWTNISEAEERALSDILPIDLLERAKRELPEERPGMVVKDLLERIESNYCDAQTSQRMFEMIRLVSEKNPVMAENLMKLAVVKLIDVIEEELEQRIKEKRTSKS